ncbi:hypothetical protein BDR07DRAFT_1482238 [Suillus spraguei]|nr:hypothetical protein BDR07DRAFT_1482238 [Suillus spraguei]
MQSDNEMRGTALGMPREDELKMFADEGHQNNKGNEKAQMVQVKVLENVEVKGTALAVPQENGLEMFIDKGNESNKVKGTALVMLQENELEKVQMVHVKVLEHHEVKGTALAMPQENELEMFVDKGNESDNSHEKAQMVQVKALKMAVEEEGPSDQSYHQQMHTTHGYGSLAGSPSGDVLDGEQIISQGVCEYNLVRKSEILDPLAFDERRASFARHKGTLRVVVDDTTMLGKHGW